MKKIIFIGLSNKKDKEPFDITTNSGKIIEKIIANINGECFKLNLVPFAPLNNLGKLRYPTKKEINESIPSLMQKIAKINPDCIVGLGNIVCKELLKIKEYKNILITSFHPSYIYIYKRKQINTYINNLIEEIKKKIGE